jgi:hypothetical protein
MTTCGAVHRSTRLRDTSNASTFTPWRHALTRIASCPVCTRPHPGPTVLTSYWSWGSAREHRAQLLADSWKARAAMVVGELSVTHPDVSHKVRRVDLMRYGHAMSIPVPGIRRSDALHALAATTGPIQFAHADLSGYSIFEEAHAHGLRAARAIVVRDRRHGKDST